MPAPVVGIDGKSPIYDPDAPWRYWGMPDIWLGPTVSPGAGKYVAKDRDYVKDLDTNVDYIVDAVDPITLVPTLRAIAPGGNSHLLSQNDVLFGVGGGAPPDTFLAYLDTSTQPYYTLTIDQRLYIRGSEAQYMKLFKGSDLGGNGVVLSKRFNNSGDFVGNDIPLVLATIDSHTNYTTKTIPSFKVTMDLPNSEVVTAVFYSQAGIVVGKQQLLIYKSSFIRDLGASSRMVSQVLLESPFLSPLEERIVEYPINVPLNALNFTGVVKFNDGAEERYPVDGTAFRLLGLDQFIPSTIGTTVDLVLDYQLAPNESAITEPSEAYTLRIVSQNNSYAVKLFGYPVWMGNALGYQMRWFLLNLDRNIFIDVTDDVRYGDNLGPYQPKLYGTVQQKSIRLNLREVSQSFPSFMQIQAATIRLNGPPDPNQNPWVVSHQTIINQPLYGDGVYGIRSSSRHYRLYIDSDIPTQAAWLEKVYLNTRPLIDPTQGSEPLAPTHVVVIIGGDEIEVPISDWDIYIDFAAPIDLYSTAFLKFIRRNGNSDMILSVAAMLIKKQRA